MARDLSLNLHQEGALMRCSCEQASREARREALEEAARVADGSAAVFSAWLEFDAMRAVKGVSDKIRALKDKPETK
jgi:hypothetical protein